MSALARPRRMDVTWEKMSGMAETAVAFRIDVLQVQRREAGLTALDADELGGHANPDMPAAVHFHVTAAPARRIIEP